MESKKLIVIFAVLGVILALVYSTTYFTGYLTRTQGPQEITEVKGKNATAVVARVIDGDTVELTSGDRVRLIGIDAHEKGEKCYKEAKERMEELVFGKNVTLESDITDKDKYRRLLRYVFVDDKFVNWVMVREGLATMYTIKPDVKYTELFEQAFLLAINEDGCLWKSS